MTQLDAVLQRDIDQIVRRLEDMAGLVDESLNRSIQALQGPNRQLAYSVILRDQRIDEGEKEIDRLCLEFLARQLPAPKSLRFVYAAIKINAALERAGDHAESIARQVLVLCSLDVEVPFQQFQEIAGIAFPMLEKAVAAFVTRSPETANLAIHSEEQVDRLRHQLGGQLVMMSQSNELPVKALSPLITIMNRLERTADQARDICQQVLYMCTGEYLQHPDSDIVRVLFVDDDNSCASQIAEAIGNSLGHPQFVFWSAGLERKPIDVGVVNYLKDRGLDISGRNSKTVAQVPQWEEFQVIVALSPDACSILPPPPTKAVCLDWSAANLAKSSKSDEPCSPNYSELDEYLHANVRDLVQAAIGEPLL